jgi:DeoR family galactitol utilization operon repressor
MEMKNISTAERRSQIAQMVIENGQVFVADLVDMFNVSEVSIRRDLTILEENQRLKRVHGGAVPIPGNLRTDSFGEKEKLHINIKARIAQVAAGLAKQGNIILLDSGTTTLQIIRNVPHFLRVSNMINLVTNSMPVSHEVLTWPSPNVTILGGIYLPDYQATVGPQTLNQLSELTADIAFLGTDGITLQGGATTANVLMAEVDRMMADHARKTVLVTDSSKFGRMGFVPVKPIASYDTIITDSDAPADMVAAIREMGVEVILV